MFHRFRINTPVAGLVAVLAAIALAACGGSSGGSTHARTTPRGQEVQTGKLQVSTESCSSKPGESEAHGTCVITLSDGNRYQCPQDVAAKLQTASAVSGSRQCKRAAALKIPAAWRAAVKALDSARDCLNGKGLNASGGPLLGMPGRHADTPVGSLILPDTTVPTSIYFYASKADANQAAPGAQSDVATSGGATQERGLAIISWTQQPDPNEQTTEIACVGAR